MTRFAITYDNPVRPDHVAEALVKLGGEVTTLDGGPETTIAYEVNPRQNQNLRDTVKMVKDVIVEVLDKNNGSAMISYADNLPGGMSTITALGLRVEVYSAKEKIKWKSIF